MRNLASAARLHLECISILCWNVGPRRREKKDPARDYEEAWFPYFGSGYFNPSYTLGSSRMSCWYILSFLLSSSLAFGTATSFSMPFDGAAYLNCSAIHVCGYSEAPGASCFTGVADGGFIPINISVSNSCPQCPVNVSVVFLVNGMPAKNELGVTCEIRCGNELVKTCSWSIHFTGVAPVSSLSYDVNTGVLSWSCPFFFSNDISQEEDPVYNVSMSGVHIASTTDTSVYPNVNNCSAVETFGITTSIGGYQSLKTKTFNINVCNAILLDKTEFYDSTKGTLGTNITFQVQSNIKVCSFTCFISIDYGDGTISNGSLEVYVSPSNEKSVTTSHIINGLVPGANRIKIYFNSTEDVLGVTIIVPSTNPEETGSDPINSTSSFHFSSIYPTITSSVSGGLDGTETTSSNIVVNETLPVTSSSPDDGDLTSAEIAIISVFATLFVLVLLICIIICVCHQAYHRCVKKKKKRKVQLTGHSNNASSPVIETNQLNSTTATEVTTAPAIEMQGMTKSENDSTDISEEALQAIRQNTVVIPEKPYQEASSEVSERRSYVEEADDCEDQTLSSDDDLFVSPQQVSNPQTNSTNKMDIVLELGVV
ncbi:PREDICTED: uncharacterized protein LOC109585257 [Amphimedon queenslandica]|nr:PREDICTED: uncharacterized protein LOC109585257 [Amphimedon queenslandica]|eukprot:XP_019856810.1 PREDICTED: uncharacterized protein LOC109585257 [Amphimedon queenslandica]